MNLIIVESPTKARTLSRFLGKEYDVEATKGHIKDLPKSTLGVNVEKNFTPEYIVVAKQTDVIETLKKASKKANIVYLATDPDREGEAIASHVEEIVGEFVAEDKIKRIVFHEITKEAVEEAIGSPRKVDQHLVNAQIARRVLDRLVGYKLSPLLWKKVRRGLSAGRVQSVAVRLIVEREREISAFKPVEYWEIFSDVSGIDAPKKDIFRVKLLKINGKPAEVGDGETAKSVVTDLKVFPYRILEVTKKEVHKHPYPPYTTSTLTQAAARVFRWSSRKTMSIAQSLYEQGLITYHRTDSTNLAASAVLKARSFIKKEYGEQYLPLSPNFYKTKSKVAQEAHEAIRPSNVSITSGNGNAKFTSDMERLYELIWKRYVTCQMSDSVYDETTIDVEAKKEVASSKSYLLRTRGAIMKFDGWKKLYKGSKSSEDDVVNLPEVVKDQLLTLIDVISEQKFTQAPARYSEAMLIKTLESLGIGRPSTYAPTISTIQVRSYVEKIEGRFKPTPVGIAVNDFLITNFPDVFEYKFTADMENSLDDIANGEEKWKESIGDFYRPFEKKLADVEKKAKRVKIEAEKLGRKCPDCKDGELVIRIGRFGRFISCSNFPDCRHTEKYVEKAHMKCPDCKKGDVIIKKTQKGKRFFGCSRYPKCKWASWRKPERVKKLTKETSKQS
ncbi:MAG TPA: type I DNA topoisomerase [Patescibacteria group bacterium]|nr:type I DNA topoisomerase [Patescibacteria group bacterium]